ncbi:hypothetical protein HDU67_002376, partial [Dinochytrium kinnereticum]
SFAVGRAFQIHAGKDDCAGQPVGNAGGRISQGVVGVRDVGLDRELFEKIGVVVPTSRVGTGVVATSTATGVIGTGVAVTATATATGVIGTGVAATATATGTVSPSPTSTSTVLTLPPVVPDAFNAIAVLTPTVNSTVKGFVTITQTKDTGDVTVLVQVTGVKPLATHGVHFHAFGDITDPAGLRAGLHFNPTNKPHRCPGVDGAVVGEAHAGDLGNLVADKEGNINQVIRAAGTGAGLRFDPVNFVVGQAVIIHANADDCKSEPTGNSGGRLSQGVVGWRNGTTFPEIVPGDVKGVKTDEPRSAVAMLTPTVNSTVKGVAVFIQKSAEDDVMVYLKAEGFEPGSWHGLHVHQFGDISNPAGLAAGLHYNPFNQPHSCPPTSPKTPRTRSDPRHAGDMGNVQADSTGTITAYLRADLLSLYRGQRSFAVGRAFQIHAGKDDCVGQPVGNAGGRISQGVVGVRDVGLDRELFEKIGVVVPTSRVGTGVVATSTAVATGVIGTGVAVTATATATGVIGTGVAATSTATETWVIGTGVAATSTATATGVIGTGVAATSTVTETVSRPPTATPGTGTVSPNPPSETIPPFLSAIAILTPTKGNEKVRGRVEIHQANLLDPTTLTVNVTLTGLRPLSTHAIHFHEF